MATINTGPAGAGGGRSAPVPWWQTPGQADAANNLDASAPPGYQYDRVQMRYVPIIGSPTDALAQRAKYENLFGQLFGAGSGGGGGADVAYPSAVPSAAAPPMVMPSGGGTAARIPTVALPDDSAAQAATFAKAKDQVGQETAGSITALRSALAARGLLGGGAEVKGTGNVLMRGQGELGDTTRTNLTNEAKRIDDFAKLGYQGAIEQRGQDITTSEGAANRALGAATTNYQGGITQRGQDIQQAGQKFQGDITKRGQDVTARGQNVGALSTLLSKLYLMPRPFDPSGIDLERQGLDTFLAFKNDERRQDYGPGGSAIDQAVHMTGPLPDPKWQAFFQALQNQGVSGITGPKRFDNVRTTPGSNQLTGASAQPDYFTGGDSFMGRTTTPYDYGDDAPYAGRVGAIKHPTGAALPDSVALLKHRARPMPEGHDTFLRRLYGNDPENLQAGLKLSSGT